MDISSLNNPNFISNLEFISSYYGLNQCSFQNRQDYWLLLLHIDNKQRSIDDIEYQSSKREIERIQSVLKEHDSILGDEIKMNEHQIPYYYDQVLKDVNRSLWTLCNDVERDEKRKSLEILIMSVLMNAKDEEGNSLKYYQGYNDIASIILLTCEEKIAYSVLKKISLHYIRDNMRDSLHVIKDIHLYFFPLIKRFDPSLYYYIIESGIEPFITLSWNITWFSYIFQDLDISRRLFDFFISSDPMMPYYLSSVYIQFMFKNGYKKLNEEEDLQLMNHDGSNGNINNNLSSLFHGSNIGDARQIDSSSISNFDIHHHDYYSSSSPQFIQSIDPHPFDYSFIDWKYDLIYSFVSKFHSRVPLSSIPIDFLIRKAMAIYELYPPRSVWPLDNDKILMSMILKYPFSWKPKNELLSKKKKKVLRQYFNKESMVSFIKYSPAIKVIAVCGAVALGYALMASSLRHK